MNFPPQLKSRRVIILNDLLSYLQQILRHIILIDNGMKNLTILSKAPSIVNFLRSK